jgi:hypothetical protein
MENEILDRYVYVGVTGNRYSPEFRNGKWYICNTEVSLLNLAALLEIEDPEELTILALTYGP